jgi:hypothetical protein
MKTPSNMPVKNLSMFKNQSLAALISSDSSEKEKEHPDSEDDVFIR